MTARYKTKVAPELVECGALDMVPAHMRVVAVTPPPTPDDLYAYIVVFDDDEAPEDLDGRFVTPLFRRDADGTVSVMGRDLDPP